MLECFAFRLRRIVWMLSNILIDCCEYISFILLLGRLWEVEAAILLFSREVGLVQMGFILWSIFRAIAILYLLIRQESTQIPYSLSLSLHFIVKYCPIFHTSFPQLLLHI